MLVYEPGGKYSLSSTIFLPPLKFNNKEKH